MPRYFFETDDEDLIVFDDEGLVLADNEAARDLAISSLPDMAKQKMPDGDQRTFTVRVLDEHRDLIYKGSLTFEGGWAASSDKLAPLRRVTE